LSSVLLSLVVDGDVDSIYNNLEVQEWDDWENKSHCNDTIHQHHHNVLELEHGVTQSSTPQEDDGDHEWKRQDVNWEESEGCTTYKLVVSNTVLQLDDVESSVSIQVLEHLLVPVDEHSCKEGKEHDFEQEHEDGNVGLTNWHLEFREVHVSIECIEQVQEDDQEGSLFILELITQHSSDQDEQTNDETKCGEESRELIHHLLKHHDQLTEILGPLKHNN
jgi:hypothetical protein